MTFVVYRVIYQFSGHDKTVRLLSIDEDVFLYNKISLLIEETFKK